MVLKITSIVIGRVNQCTIKHLKIKYLISCLNYNIGIKGTFIKLLKYSSTWPAGEILKIFQNFVFVTSIKYRNILTEILSHTHIHICERISDKMFIYIYI